MRVIAFVGPSGTGKSYKSLDVASKNGADAIIDDGLLISRGKVIAGTSAKSEPTMMASVKHALFMKKEHSMAIKRILKTGDFECVMILGTSEAMAKKIADALELGEIEKFIHIEDVATRDEMEAAYDMRVKEGKHIIPVPTFEIKKQFSGYFLHPLRYFQKNLDNECDSKNSDKSIVRPTFSYLGEYSISDSVLISMAIYEAEKIEGIEKITNINVRKTIHGVHLDMTASVKFGHDIQKACKLAQKTVHDSIEQYTSVNVRRVHILVKMLAM